MNRISFVLCAWIFSTHMVYAEESSIPSPVFVKESRSTATKEGNTAIVRIERLAGCNGDRELARRNVVSSTNILQEPVFRGEKYTPSILQISSIGAPACILDDDPDGVEDYNESVMEFEEYLRGVFSCGCVMCSDGKEDFDESEVLERVTEQHKKEYTVYKMKREKEIKLAQQAHQQYKSDYTTWSKKRSEELDAASIRIVISPKEDIPAGSLTVYHFTWYIQAWCDQIQSASRHELQATELQHPEIKAGEQFSIWFDDVNIALSWGVFLHDAKHDAAAELQSIIDTPEIRLEENESRSASEKLPILGLPVGLKDRSFETSEARSSSIIDTCCEC